MNHAIIGLIYQNVLDLRGTAVKLSVFFYHNVKVI